MLSNPLHKHYYKEEDKIYSLGNDDSDDIKARVIKDKKIDVIFKAKENKWYLNQGVDGTV